jgi:hypothetical protein
MCACYVNDEPFDQRQSDDAFATAQSMIMNATIEHEDMLTREGSVAGSLSLTKILTAIAGTMAVPGLLFMTDLISTCSLTAHGLMS